jgi:thiamine biosynthesis lipoprotein ApbE
MIADAYATALMVMPFTDSMALIESESDLEAYWIIENEDGVVEEIVSSGFPSE